MHSHWVEETLKTVLTENTMTSSWTKKEVTSQAAAEFGEEHSHLFFSLFFFFKWGHTFKFFSYENWPSILFFEQGLCSASIFMFRPWYQKCLSLEGLHTKDKTGRVHTSLQGHKATTISGYGGALNQGYFAAQNRGTGINEWQESCSFTMLRLN